MAEVPTKFQHEVTEIGLSLILCIERDSKAIDSLHRGEVLFAGGPLILSSNPDLTLQVICGPSDVLKHIWNVHKDSCLRCRS